MGLVKNKNKNKNTAFIYTYGPDPKTLNSVNRKSLMGKTVHNKVIFKSTSQERGYKANCLSSFSPDTIFCFCFGQVHKNISDSEDVKSNVKFHSFKTTVLTVQKLTEIDSG